MAGPERNRRFIALMVLSAVFLFTSWIEKYLDDAYPETDIIYDEKIIDHNVKHKHQTEVGRRKQEDDEDQEQEEGRHMPGYARIIKSKSRVNLGGPVVHLDIMACLPRFICEVHAQPPGASMSELERDILSLFRSYVVLEDPSSPVYQYQVAAHMGQLSMGFEPTPCHGLFSACALSRTQLIEILKGVKTSRRMFL